MSIYDALCICFKNIFVSILKIYNVLIIQILALFNTFLIEL
jgi:hypothetical protein